MSAYAAPTLQTKSPKKGLLLTFLALFKLPHILYMLTIWHILSQFLSHTSVNMAMLNLVSLLLILTTCLGGFGYLAASNKIRLWHPIIWFLFTSALYYGFGPLLYYFGNLETISFVDNYYPVKNDDLFLVNSVALVGVAAVIFFYLVFSTTICFNTKLPTADYLLKSNQIAVRKYWKAACFLMIIGLPVKLIFTFPYSIGLFDWILPGFIKTIEFFSVLALIPLYLIKNVSLKYKLTFYFLATFGFITAMLTLSKLAVLIMLFVILLGAVLKGISLVRIGLIGVLILYFYVAVLSPMVTYGRLTVNVSGIQNVTDSMRLARDVLQAKTSDYVSNNQPNVQGWWARFNYANAQAFAIERYDSGQAGNSMSDVLWVVVPRLLYPDKPNLSSHGTRFNELVDGNPYSSSGPGIIVEGYWNYGWYGVIFVSFIMGLFYFLWERYINSQLKKSQFQYLPVMFLGLFAALTQDSWFVISTFAILTLALAMHWLIRKSFHLYCNNAIFKSRSLKNK